MIPTNIEHDLWKLNLLRQTEVDVIKSTSDINKYYEMIETMVSETILNGGKKEFYKFTTYLQSYSDMKYLAQYWEKLCKLVIAITFKNNN